MSGKKDRSESSAIIIERALIPICEKYAQSSETRALIQLFGGPVGSAIDTLLSGEAAKMQAKRFKKFVERVSETLKNIQEEKIDREFLESEEFLSLFQNILGRVLESYEEQKILLFGNIFVNSVKTDGAKVYYKERFINIVADLSVVHVEILKYYFEREEVFRKESRKGADAFTSLESVFVKFKITEAQAEAFCNDLLRYNLLYDDGIGRFDYKRGHFRITDSAIDFINFILLED